MNNLKFIDYDSDNKGIFDFKSVIQEEMNHIDSESREYAVQSREYSFELYRDRYILVLNDNAVIGYLVYGNHKLFKSSIIKFFYFIEGYKDDFYIKQVISEFMSRENNPSVCLFHEPGSDVLIQLGFVQSNLSFRGSLYLYFFDRDMKKVVEFLPFIKPKSEETVGSYYYRKMEIIQKMLFALMFFGIAGGIFVSVCLLYVLETIFTGEPFTLLGITLVILDILVAAISIPGYFSLKSRSKKKINYAFRASGFRVKLDYNNMFF